MKDEYINRKVTLMVRVKIMDKWVRKPAIYGRSWRVIPGLVVIGSKEVRFHNALYDIRYFVRGQAKYLPAGSNASDAEELRARTARQLSAQVIADAAGLKTEVAPTRKPIWKTLTGYIKNRFKEGSWQYGRYTYVVALFREVCRKTFVDEIAKDDLLGFCRNAEDRPVFRDRRQTPSKRIGELRRKKREPISRGTLAARTIFTYFGVLCKCLKDLGVDEAIFPAPPQYEEPEITIYSAQQLKVLFSLLFGSLRIALSLMLKCGLRRKEVAFAEFSDIDFENKTVLVRGRPERGYHVKNYCQRYVPVPDDLLAELAQCKRDHPGQSLIVPNKSGKPDLYLISTLKRFVYLHGLRCGGCTHCRIGNPQCEEWELHKFRRTYATALVRHVDLRTAQRYLGHKRITSTERYLRAASAVDGQRRVSQIDFTKPFYAEDADISTKQQSVTFQSPLGLSNTDSTEQSNRK